MHDIIIVTVTRTTASFTLSGKLETIQEPTWARIRAAWAFHGMLFNYGPKLFIESGSMINTNK